jgi:hypothetical protein
VKIGIVPEEEIFIPEYREPEFDNLAFNNSKWAWAIPFNYEWPRRDVFDCFENKLESSLFKGKRPCPICLKPSDELLWINFSSPSYTWESMMGTEGPLSICETCLIEVDYIQTSMN